MIPNLVSKGRKCEGRAVSNKQPKWIKKCRGRWASLFGLAAGGALVTQGAEAALVEVATQSFTRLSDGSLQVTFASGRSLIVPEGDWTLVNGRVFVESAAVSLSGASLSDTAAVSDASPDSVTLFGRTLAPWTLAGGALGGGLVLGYYSNAEEAAAATSSLKATGITPRVDISNRADDTADDAGQVTLTNNLETISLDALFEGGTGSYTYTVLFTSDSAIDGKFYSSGAQLYMAEDLKATLDGAYTLTIQATDAESNQATASVVINLDLESEATTEGTIADETFSGDLTANTVLVDNLGQYFTDPEGGSYTYSVEVTLHGDSNDPGAQEGTYLDLLKISGDQLLLAQDLTDTLIEGYTRNPNSADDSGEDIILSVNITAIDSAGNTVVGPQTFKLTLDARTNDAPELVSGNTVVVSATANTAIASTDLASQLTDDEGNALVWLSTVINAGGTYQIDTSGILTGTAGSADETLYVEVTDDGTTPSTYTLPVFIDVA